MKEMIIFPDGTYVYLVVSDWVFDNAFGKYKAEIEWKGVVYTMHYYRHFWA